MERKTKQSKNREYRILNTQYLIKNMLKHVRSESPI